MTDTSGATATNAPATATTSAAVTPSTVVGTVASAVGNAALTVVAPVLGAANALGLSPSSVASLASSVGTYSWGQIFGNLGLILLGIMLIGISLTVGTRTTVIQIAKGALK